MTVEDWRRFYAEEVRFAAPVKSEALVDAFARVPREKFLGPGPWLIGSASPRLGAPLGQETGNARDLYHDLTVAIDQERGINNGQPSALALWIDALDLEPGDRVFHVGCGLGYYTAIMAEMVGDRGHVAAIEIEADLAARARENLLGYKNVTVYEGDGALHDKGKCDAIFLNAGVTHPHVPWLEQFGEGGRMVLPLTASTAEDSGKGLMVKIVRKDGGFPAEVISYVLIYPCASMRDPWLEAPLAKALETKSLMKLKSVRLERHDETGTCLLHGADVCLSSA